MSTTTPLNGHTLSPLPSDLILERLRSDLDAARKKLTALDQRVAGYSDRLRASQAEVETLTRELEEAMVTAITDGKSVSAPEVKRIRSQLAKLSQRELEEAHENDAGTVALQRCRADVRALVADVNNRRRTLRREWQDARRAEAIETARSAVAQMVAICSDGDGIHTEPDFLLQRYVGWSNIIEDAHRLRRALTRTLGEEEHPHEF